MNRDGQATYFALKSLWWLLLEIVALGITEFIVFLFLWDVSLSGLSHKILDYGIPLAVVLIPIILAKKENRPILIIIGAIAFILRMYGLGIFLRFFSGMD
jgi:hypothetical protein